MQICSVQQGYKPYFGLRLSGDAKEYLSKETQQDAKESLLARAIDTNKEYKKAELVVFPPRAYGSDLVPGTVRSYGWRAYIDLGVSKEKHVSSEDIPIVSDAKNVSEIEDAIRYVCSSDEPLRAFENARYEADA